MNQFYKNLLNNNSLTSILGGIHGVHGDGGSTLAYNGTGYGLFFESNSYNNTILLNNTLDGDSIIYYYNQTFITIEGHNLSLLNNPTNLGKIVLIKCNNITIKNNSVNKISAGPGICLIESNNNSVIENNMTKKKVENSCKTDNLKRCGDLSGKMAYTPRSFF